MEQLRETLSIECADGTALAVERIAPRSEPVGACWLGHALMTNRRTLDCPRGRGLASTLAAAGLDTYLVDVRGHGGSRLPRERGWSYEDLLRYDLPAITRFVRERHPGLPLAAVGHSLVGGALLAFLGRQAGGPPLLDAVVTISSNIWLRRLEPSAMRWARKRSLAVMMGAVARVLGRLPTRAMGLGTDDVSRGFAEDMARWTATDRWGGTDGSDYLASLANVRAPVLAVVGAGDRLFCHVDSARRFHAALTGAAVEVVVEPVRRGYRADHIGLVTDPGSRPLWERIAAWVTENSPRKPVGGDRFPG